MMIEEGKIYRAKNGTKVGPLRPWDSEEHPFIGDLSEPCSKTSKGFIFRSDGRNYEYRDLDLIAEWTEGPVRTVTRREVVSGQYGIVKIEANRPGSPNPRVLISAVPTSTELKAAAAVLLELAEALNVR